MAALPSADIQGQDPHLCALPFASRILPGGSFPFGVRRSLAGLQEEEATLSRRDKMWTVAAVVYSVRY